MVNYNWDTFFKNLLKEKQTITTNKDNNIATISYECNYSNNVKNFFNNYNKKFEIEKYLNSKQSLNTPMLSNFYKNKLKELDD